MVAHSVAGEQDRAGCSLRAKLKHRVERPGDCDYRVWVSTYGPEVRRIGLHALGWGGVLHICCMRSEPISPNLLTRSDACAPGRIRTCCAALRNPSGHAQLNAFLPDKRVRSSDGSALPGGPLATVFEDVRP